MKKIGLVFSIVISILTCAYGQMNYHSAYEIKQAMDFFNYSKTHSQHILVTLTQADIKGSPFLDDNFTEGSVFTTSKTQFVSVPLRYNIYNDDVEFRGSDGQAYAIAVPEVIERIEIGENQIEYIPFLVQKKMKRGYFIVLEKGEVSLYKKPKVVFEEAKSPAAYQEAQPAKFVRRADEYYIRAGMDAAKPLLKLKDLEEILPGHQKDVIAYVKKHRLKLNNPENLQDLVRYYNSL